MFQKGEFVLNDKPRKGSTNEMEDDALQKLLDEDAAQSTRDLAKILILLQL